MKFSRRLTAALLAVFVAAAAFPPVGLAADGASFDLRAAVESAADGETITLPGNARVETTGGGDDPWMIDKQVTIQGNGAIVSVYTGGILLTKDVEFRDLELHFTSNVRNAVMANGHTLTLDSVTAGTRSHAINLFCGGLRPADYEGFSVPAPGGKGTVVIRGSTNLQPGVADNLGSGNIFAGSLCMGAMWAEHGDVDGPATAFSGDAEIRVEGCADPGGGVLPLGQIYAGGAQQRLPFGQEGGKVTSANPELYTVDGTVTVAGPKFPGVDGAGSAATDVVYEDAGGKGYPAERLLSNISSLSVESGHLVLKSGSGFREGGAVSVPSGAVLSVSNLRGAGGAPDLEVDRFDGGGVLIMGADQTVSVMGRVSGGTSVAIGGLFNNQSASEPAAGHTYIRAPGSADGDFTLLPHPNNPGMALVRDASGDWTAVAGTTGGDGKPVASFAFLDKSVSVLPGEEAEFELDARDADGDAVPLDAMELTVEVNGSRLSAGPDPDGYYEYVYTGSGVSAYVAGYSFYITVPGEGVYSIRITLPTDETAGGGVLTDTAELTVGEGGTAFVSVPGPNAGLKWTGLEQTGVDEGTGYSLTGHKGTDVGSYTAVASLDGGYRWDDGTEDDKSIPWSIGKADGPAAPGALAAFAPSAPGAADGRISGTTGEMEYDTDAGFANPRPCAAPETTGLAAGVYYVRMKATETHEPGASTAVTVPAPGAPAGTGISVGSTGHKTVYKVGEPLDVADLTIEVAYSDGGTQSVPVTADMVSGFDSAAPAERLELTITYEGRTTGYTIRITASEEPGSPKYRVTIENGGDGAVGAGEYEAGATVVIRPGSRSGYVFAAWQAAGAELENRLSPETRFVMPEGAVSLLVTWKSSGGSRPPAGHKHAWSLAWASGETHHWHNCAASGCPITQNSRKSGYGAHTAGEWVVDQAATSSQSGSRHRACLVCGYVMERQTIPATGGNSGGSGGGSSGSGGGSGGGSSSSGGSLLGPFGSGGSVTTSTEKNPDGSTTTVSTDRSTGAVTETTKWPDGSRTVVETRKDGTVTATETAADGSTVKTLTRPDGSGEVTVKQAGGATASLRLDQSGRAAGEVRLPAKAVRESRDSGKAVALPVPELPAAAGAEITVHTGSVRPLRVEVPVAGSAYSTVAFLVNGDGTETMLRTAVLKGGRMTLEIHDGAVVRFRENGGSFSDADRHWAAAAIRFVTARELFSGKTPGTFAPDAPMSRAMLMTVLARLDGADTAGGTAYEKGMAWAVSHGISDGRNSGAQVTREQLAAMLHRYAGSPAATNRELRFRDAGAVSGYAREAALWAVETGILSGYGDGTLAPGGKATRAQTAAMLMRYVNYIGG